MKSLSTFFLVLFLAGGIIFSTGSLGANDTASSTSDSTETEPTETEPTAAESTETEIPNGIPRDSKAVSLPEQRIQYRDSDGQIHNAQIKEYFTDANGEFAYAQLSNGTLLRTDIDSETGEPCFN